MCAQRGVDPRDGECKREEEEERRKGVEKRHGENEARKWG